MKTAIIYARYSSDSQTEQSIEGQLRVCQEYAKKNNLLVVDTYIDRAMTGTNDLRPDFQRMMKDSYKKQWAFIIVYKLDRFSRDKYESTIHKRTLKNNGVKLVSAMENIPDSPEGIILESLLEGMNQYYSAELSQKVKRGLYESYQKGNYTGGSILYGYDVANMKYVVNEQEAEIVREVFTKYAQGYTAVAIAKALKERGIRNKKGKYLDSTKIYKIIANQKYSGKVKYGDTVYENIYPAIIDEDTWRQVQSIRTSNKHAPGRKKDIFDFILSGKLACGDCKRLMVGESGTSHTGAKHYYYTCLSRRRKRMPCKLKSVPKEWLEDLIIQKTWETLSTEDTLTQIADTLCKIHEKESRNNANLKSLLAKKATAEKATQNLIKAIEQGIITEQTKIRLKELETQISALQFDIEMEQQRTYAYLTREEIKEYLVKMTSGDFEDIATRKLLVKTFIREVILYDDRIIITYHFSERYDEHKITPESVKETERQVAKPAFSLILGSYNLPNSAPKRPSATGWRSFCAV